MTYSEKQAKRNPIGRQSSIGSHNGSQHPASRQHSLRRPAPARSPDPYEDDRAFQTALRFFKNGKVETALNLVDKLLKKYPGDKNLEKFKTIIQKRIPDKDYAYRDHPSYSALHRNLREGDWAAGLQAADALLASYPDVQAISDVRDELVRRLKKQESRTRIRLVGTFIFLALIFVALSSVVYRYIRQPVPLAEILMPGGGLTYPPHYLFSIQGVDQPVGVALSQDGERIYVTEMGGSRMVRFFDRDGDPLGSFTSPKTGAAERAPVYVATDSAGRVYVSDRMQHAISIFTAGGEYVDALLSPNLTLSEYVEMHAVRRLDESSFTYNLFKKSISIEASPKLSQTLELLDLPLWSPLGVRIGLDDEMILTDVSRNDNRVIEISLGDQVARPEWIDFDPPISAYGSSGSGNGEMLFPNSAVADSQGRVYVSDGNNRRISVWDSAGNYQFDFGSGTGPGSLSLPRGLFTDRHDRLYVADAVAQNIKVYDVSGSQPEFLFEFGDFGKGDGLFNYPNDIAVDRSGRLYIADRENNRVQVWSY